ncbi:MAG: sigma-54-dependent Fis family transcriptional regulator [Methylothermaceae bacterium]|nr:sigma-54-dependent Fis family transcriptional regulator [Methylothermaceae bacterium]
MLNRIQGHNAQPVIGIMAGESVDWETKGLEHFTDIIQWPCPLGELRFRLAKAGLDRRSSDREAPLTANLIGRSNTFQEVTRFIHQVAPIQVPVLILGETGTGKEVVARAIHYHSRHQDQPFVPFNCGGIPAELLENELFGHEAGAFTSAQRKQVGLISQANGGSLFLDEIDTLPLPAQAALLRFLQDHQYRPLGSGHLNRADVRVLAASNADLPTLVKENRFREDLWYRLNVLTLKLPSLRERREDIPLLANHFLRCFCENHGKAVREFPSRILRQLTAYPWPGNVRELENWVQRYILLGEERLPSTGETNPASAEFMDKSFQRSKAEAVAAFEKDYLIELIIQTHGNITQAAQIAGKERRCLGKLLKKHGIDPAQFKIP